MSERDQDYVVRVYLERLPDFMEFVERFHGLIFAYAAASETGRPVARLMVEAESEADAIERVTEVLAEMDGIEVLRLAVER